MESEGSGLEPYLLQPSTSPWNYDTLLSTVGFSGFLVSLIQLPVTASLVDTDVALSA